MTMPQSIACPASWTTSFALALALCLCLPGVRGLAQPNRSAWMWSTPSHAYGSTNVMGNASRETEVISYFGAWNFDRIYYSAGNLPATNPSVISNWNAKLSSYGIESQMLLGENTWIYPSTRPSLLSLLQTTLLNFNNSRSNPAERFAGLHLDIEPQGLPSWQNGSANKKQLLFYLRDTYADVRTLLDNNGAAGVPIYADLPVWFDTATDIGWTNSAERDQWFDDVAESLAGISLMAFERSSLNSIISGVNWEVQNFNGEVRIGLNAAEIAAGSTFANYAAFNNMANQLDAHYGAAIGGIDYQPFFTFVDRAPTPTFDADFNADGVVDGADFLAWQRGYETGSNATIAQGDADGSGAVNVFDLDAWKRQFGSTPSPANLIPEPAAQALVFVGVAAAAAGTVRRRA